VARSTTVTLLDSTVFLDASGSDPEMSHAAWHIISGAVNGTIDAHASLESVQEVFSVTARRGGDRKRALAAARHVESAYKIVELDRAILSDALSLLEVHERISGRDALILASAQRIGAGAVVTRDKGLGNAAGDLWVDPSDKADLARLLRES
jgi:predicted nucleic acid-binding protein